MRTNERLHSEAMNVSHLRNVVLMTALAAAALIASSSTAKAQAPSEPADPGVRCAAKVGPGQYEFFLPGEKATDVNGNKWVCGPDGQWFRDYSALVRNPGSTGGIKATASYLIANGRAAAVSR